MIRIFAKLVWMCMLILVLVTLWQSRFDFVYRGF